MQSRLKSNETLVCGSFASLSAVSIACRIVIAVFVGLISSFNLFDSCSELQINGPRKEVCEYDKFSDELII